MPGQLYIQSAPVVMATQWNRPGDHPDVHSDDQRFYRNALCAECGRPMGDHGKIRLGSGWSLICPGMWVVEYLHLPGVLVMNDASFRAAFAPAGNGEPVGVAS